jgi:uncharacterized protein with PIN domain
MGQSSHRAQSLKEQLTIKLYLDEMVPTDLARVLRQYGYDVVTAQEAGMLVVRRLARVCVGKLSGPV